MTRRTSAAAPLAAALLASCAGGVAAQPAFGTHEPRTYDEGLVPRFSFEVIELDARGTLATALLDTGSGKASAWRRAERVPLGPAVALLACGALLEEAAGEGLPAGSPCEGALGPEAGAEAARAAVAALGGPDALARWLRQAGDAETRLGEEGATSTPEALLGHLVRLLGEDGLEPSSRAALLGWMGAVEGGALDGVPAGWEVSALSVAADPATTLTLAALVPPGRPPVLLVIAVQGAHEDAGARRAVHAEVARIAAQNARLADEGYFD